MNDEFILEVINPTTAISVLPSYEDSGEGVILAVSEPSVEVTPSVLATEITASIAIYEMYILVIDVEMLEAWQNNLNAAVISLNNLWVSHNELSDDVEEQLSAYNLFVDNTTLSIIDLENTDQNLVSSIQLLELSYTDLEEQISFNAALINANLISIEQTEESINVNAISISSLSTQLSDLSDELGAKSNLINQNVSNIQANDGSIASLGIAVTAIEVEIAGYGAIYASAGALDALDTRVEYNEDGIVAIASHITELEASVPFGFNAYTAWEFRSTLEGWQAAESASAYQLKDCAVVTGNGYIFIHLFATPPIDGSIYDTITMTWRTVVPGGIWEGKIYYKNNNESTWQEAASFEQFVVNTFTNETFVLSSTNWATATQVTDIAIRFSSGGTYEIDSIGIGRRSGTGAYGSITEEAYIRAAADGSIEGKYGVKIDVNGKVSGFGLIQTANDDEPYSEFNFSVDALNIYDPDSDNDVPLFHLDSNQVAFSVPIIQSVGFSTGSEGTGWRLNDNGVAEFHGINIYNDEGDIILSSGSGINGTFIQDATIESAAIANAAITEAKIGTAAITEAKIGTAAVTSAKIGTAEIETAHIVDANVTTLKVAGNAITIPVSARRTADLTLTPSWQTLISASVDSDNADVAIFCSFTHKEHTGFGGAGYFRILRGTTVLFDQGNFHLSGNQTMSLAHNTLATSPGATSQTYYLQGMEINSAQDITCLDANITLIACKR